MKDLQTFEFCYPSEANAKIKIQVNTYLPLKKTEVRRAILKESKKWLGNNTAERLQMFVDYRTNYVMCVQGMPKGTYMFFPV